MAQPDIELRRDEVLLNKKTFRAPFTIHSYAFSPIIDVLAIASRDGDVLLKRLSWKTVWKTKISFIGVFGSQIPKNGQITTMTFCPTGLVLAVGTSNGYVHFLDTDHGKIKHTVFIGDTSCSKLVWIDADCDIEPQGTTDEFLRRLESEEVNKQRLKRADRYDKVLPTIDYIPDNMKSRHREKLCFVKARFDESRDKIKTEKVLKENLDAMNIDEITFNNTFNRTMLFVVREDLKIDILAGTLPIGSIDINKECESHNMYPISIYTVTWAPRLGICVAVLGQGSVPETTLFEPGFQEVGPDIINHSILMNFNYNNIWDSSFWELSYRNIKLHHQVAQFRNTVEKIKRSWETEMKTMSKWFNDHSSQVCIGQLLLDELLSGSTDSIGEATLDRGIGEEGMKAMNKFVFGHFMPVYRLIREEMAPEARTLAYQATRFSEIVGRLALDAKLSKGAWDYLQQPVYDVDITSARSDRAASASKYIESITGCVALDELRVATNQLQFKVAQLAEVADRSLQELVSFLRWMSTLTPFLRATRVDIIEKSKDTDVQKLLDFIIKFFIKSKSRRDQFNKLVLCPEKVFEELKEEDVDELQYFREAKKYSLKLAKEIEKELKAMKPVHGVRRKNFSPPKSSRIQEMVLLGDEQDFISFDRVGSFFFSDVLDELALEFDLKPDLQLSNSDGLDDPELYSASLIKILSNVQGAVERLPKTFDQLEIFAENNLKRTWTYSIISDNAHQGFCDFKMQTRGPEDDILIDQVLLAGITNKQLFTRLLTLHDGSIEFWNSEPHSRNVSIDKEKIAFSQSDTDMDRALTVDVNEEVVDDTIILDSFVNVFTSSSAEIFMLANFKSEAGATMRKVVQLAPGGWMVQRKTHQQEKIESCVIACEGDLRRGAATSENNSKLTIFNVAGNVVL